MFLRVLSRAGLSLKRGWRGLLLPLTLLVAGLAAGAVASGYNHWKHGEPIFSLPVFSASQSSCGAQVVSLIAGKGGDTVQAHACLSGMPRFANMSEDQFAKFATEAAPSQPYDFVLIGQTDGTSSGRAYHVEVYLVRDGFPDSTYTVYFDDQGKIVRIG